MTDDEVTAAALRESNDMLRAAGDSLARAYRANAVLLAGNEALRAALRDAVARLPRDDVAWLQERHHAPIESLLHEDPGA